MTANTPPSAAAGDGGVAAPDFAPQDFPARVLISWTRLLSSNRKLLTVLLIAQAILFSAFSAWIIWQPDVLQFFSADSAEVQSIHHASQQPGLATQLRFDVHLTTPAQPGDLETVTAATRKLAAALATTHNGSQFRSLWTGVDPLQLATSYGNLQALAPLLQPDLQTLESRLNVDYLQNRFAQVRQHLVDPDGDFLLHQLAADPLNLSDSLADRFPSLAAPAASFHEGVLTTRDHDGRPHAMIVADPTSLPSDQKAAELTLAAANEAIAAIKKSHPTLEVWTIGPHRGYVENASRIKRDVSLISALGSLAVALAIALYFRRISTALLCLIPPIVGVGLALGLAGLAHVTLPLILLGFAGLLCGSTTDYGILIIAESRRLFAQNKNQWHPDLPAIAARHMLGPISMSVATSVTGYAALALSASPGLAALGLFVAAATLCIWLITFLILPAYLGPWILPRVSPQSKIENRKSKIFVFRYVGCLLFLTLTALFANSALHIRFNTNPRSLDGTSTSARAEEDAFAQVWGDLRNRGIVLVQAATPEAALAANQHLHDYLEDQQRDGLIANFTSSAGILPDQQSLNARLTAWQNFWTPARRDHLRSLLTAAATANHFNPTPFASYADRVATLELPTATDRLAASPASLFPGLITTTPTSTTLATIVQMNPTENLNSKIENRKSVSLRRATAWGSELRARYPDLLILSGNLLFFDATDRARAEGERLGPWCLLAILLPLWLYFRRLRKAWLTLTCLLIGFLWVLAAASHLGGLNLLSLVPILFTLGVAVDYGIYASILPQLRTQDSELRTSPRPIFLCALTTILGSGSLLFATHPALRWLGLTLVAGITGGYLTSHFLVAPLTRKLVPRPSGSASVPSQASQPQNRPKLFLIRFSVFGFRFFLRTFLLLLTLLLCIPPITELLLTRQKPLNAQIPSLPAPQQIAPRTFTLDNAHAWMRFHPTTSDPNSGLWEISLCGNASLRGAAVSRLAAPIDCRIENEMLDQLDQLLPNEFSRFLITRTFAANSITLPHYIAPEYQEEIYASATGSPDPHSYLAPSYPRILSYHALHDISQMLIDNPLIVPNDFACTGIISLPAYSAKQDGHLLLARNFDFEGGDSFGKQKSLTYVFPPESGPDAGIPFAHVAWPGLAGAVTGINQQKIALFLNAAATADFRRIGTPTILMARDILQHAHSLAEAETILRQTQTFVSDIIVIADGKTGQARVFEKSPARFASYDVAERGGGSAVVANHLITPTFADDPVNRSRLADGTTAQRYARARQLLDRLHESGGGITPATLASLLRDKKALDDKPQGLGNRNAIDGLIACHSVILDATTGQLWVAAWPNAEGEFIGIDILAMLNRRKLDAAGSVEGPPVNFSPAASPPSLPMDTIMTDGSWQRFQSSRSAANESENALQASDYPSAVKWADDAIRDNPGFYLGHELRGRALLKKGDKPAAKIELETALNLNPPYAQRRKAIKDLIEKCDSR